MVEIKKARVNFYISEVQKERINELIGLHGYQNINQACKFLFQRGLVVECSSAGIIHTNEKLDEMVSIMRNDVAVLSSTATESQVCNNTIPLELEEDG